MKVILYAVFLTALCGTFVVDAVAQCTKVKIAEPGRHVEAGKTMKFTVILTGRDPKVTPTYEWTVEKARLVSGQGTREITVDTRGVPAFSNFVTNVSVGGFQCKVLEDFDSTTTFIDEANVAERVQAFIGPLDRVTPRSLLDLYMSIIGDTKKNTFYLISYGGPNSKPGDAAAALKKMTGMLANVGEVELGDIKTMVGGNRKTDAPIIEVWRAPPGAEPPTLDPAPAKKN